MLLNSDRQVLYYKKDGKMTHKFSSGISESMQFLYEPRWGVSNRSVEKLDNFRVELNGYCAMLESQSYGDPGPYLSLETVERIKEGVKKSKKSLRRLKEKDLPLFDCLLLQDIERNIRILEAYYNYFYNPKNGVRIGRFLSTIFGRTAYSILLNAVSRKNFPHRDLHRYSELMHGLETMRMDAEVIFENMSNPLFEKLRAGFKAELEHAREFVNQFYSEKGVLKKIGDYHFEFAPRGWGFSFWDLGNLLATVDPDRILCFRSREDGNYRFFNGFANLVGVHEISHGLEDILSEKTMPQGLRPSTGTFINPVHGPVGEGIALLMEHIAIDSMKKNGEKLGMSIEDIQRCIYFEKSYIPKKLIQVVHDILTIKEYEEETNEKFPKNFHIEAHKALSQITQIPRYEFDYYLFEDNEIAEPLNELTYFFGQRRIKRLADKMKRKGIPENIMIHALLSGFWCDSKAQEQFIFKLYLPEVMKNE